MMMKKLFLTRIAIRALIILGIFCTIPCWPQAQQAFKFPKRITFQLLKDNKIIGQCYLTFLAGTGQKQYHRPLSALKMSNFKALDVIPRETWATYVFSEDFSLVSDKVRKVNTKGTSFLDLNDPLGFGDSKDRYFDYKEENSYRKYQVASPPGYMNINFLSSFLVVSGLVNQGTTSFKKQVNYVDGTTVKTLKLKLKGRDWLSFEGKGVPVTEVELRDKKKALFRFSVYEDKDRGTFPIRVYFPYRFDRYELRALRVEAGRIRIIKLGQLVVTTLPFMDSDERKPLASFEVSRLLNEAVFMGIREARVDGNPPGIMEMDPDVPGNEKIINKMSGIFLDAAMENTQKADHIVNEIMDPNNIKIIITGYYRGRQYEKVKVSPVVIIKYDRRFVNKNLVFEWDRLFCRSPVTRELLLCRPAARQIADMVKELVELY